MPYIDKERRKELLRGFPAKTPGELNFILTTECIEYLGLSLSYSKLNEIVGVLECIKLELYRRVIANYEDEKIKENGDVYYGS